MKILLFSIFASLALISVGESAIVSVTIDSSNYLLQNASGVNLTAGTSADFDGAIVQLGYFSTATLGNNFSGTWVPLTGLGGSSGVLTSIGDATNSGAGNLFTNTLNIDTTIALNTPAVGTPLAIRIYNNTAFTGPNAATQYATISNTTAGPGAGSWVWPTPGSGASIPTVSMFLLDSGLIAADPTNIVPTGSNAGFIRTTTRTLDPHLRCAGSLGRSGGAQAPAEIRSLPQSGTCKGKPSGLPLCFHRAEQLPPCLNSDTAPATPKGSSWKAS
jgi:hypothetical protein